MWPAASGVTWRSSCLHVPLDVVVGPACAVFVVRGAAVMVYGFLV